MSEGFKVTLSRKSLIELLICLIIAEAMTVAILLTTEYILLGSIMLTMLTLISIMAILATSLFYVKVNGSVIRVRTRSGRKYEFRCSDIQKVGYYKTIGSKQGAITHLTIKTKSCTVEIRPAMTGFTTMAGYLLDKHEAGEIKSTAITYSCQGKLRQWKNGDVRKKKKPGIMYKK